MSLMKFRLRDRCGPHIETDPRDPVREVLVTAGQVFESAADRAAQYPEKFERMPDEVRVTADQVRNRDGTPILVKPGEAQPKAPAAADPTFAPRPVTAAQAEYGKTLDAMTFDELKKYAAAEDIDLKAAKTREQALKIVKDASL